MQQIGNYRVVEFYIIKLYVVQRGWCVMKAFTERSQEFKDIYQENGVSFKLLHREIHHRIKNNLNTIASILGLQINNLDRTLENDPKEILERSKRRIETIAINHELLYNNHEVGKVDFKKYTEGLTDAINQAYGRNISVHIENHNIPLPIETMFQIGIILSELFTNSVKYAFEQDGHDRVNISLSQRGNHLFFSYHESRNENIDITKIMESQTLGMRLIKLTVKQLGGTLEVSRNKGLIFTIDFMLK